MNIEQIFVGTELLLGNITNTNARFIAEQCVALGLTCVGQTVVGDDESMLRNALSTSLSRSDFVIVTGGMGAADDDITKKTVTDVLNLKLVPDEKLETSVKKYYAGRHIDEPQNARKLYSVPDNCTVMYNDNGITPGFIIEKEGKKVILLPGQPVELEGMFHKYVSDYLKKSSPEAIVTSTVKICGIGENEVSDKISDLFGKDSNPSVTVCAKTGEVHLHVTAKAPDEKAALKLIKPVIREIKTRFGFDIYTTDDSTTLEKALVDLLVANKMTISTFESCTGGLVAGRIINVPGVSDVFKHGHITYSNSAKMKFLGVRKKALDDHTAVSAEVCEEMVKGALLSGKPDVVVAVTGLAGPDGGTEEKPVGLVYIGCGVKGNITVNEYHFNGDRKKIRESAVAAAITLARKCVLEYISRSTFG